jgi:hypothetical protein
VSGKKQHSANTAFARGCQPAPACSAQLCLCMHVDVINFTEKLAKCRRRDLCRFFPQKQGQDPVLIFSFFSEQGILKTG